MNALSSDGILHVNGTTSDDTITFAVKGKTLTCYRNGVPDSIPLASVSGIVITGQDGNDTIDASKLSIPVTITTGSGNDSILGSQAVDGVMDVLDARGGRNDIRACGTPVPYRTPSWARSRRVSRPAAAMCRILCPLGRS